MSYYYGPSVVRNGLSLAFDAGNTKSYISGSTTWTDISGTGNVGTLANGPTFDYANKGVIVFDGTNDILTIPSTKGPIQFGTNPFSLEFWLKATSNTARQALLAADGGFNSAPVFAIQGQGTTGALGVGVIGFADTINTGNGALAANTWTHIVVSRVSTASNNSFIYVNGVLKATGTLSNNYSTAYGVGIAHTPGTGEYFGGRIGMVKIYKGYALTRDNARLNYNATKGRFGL